MCDTLLVVMLVVLPIPKSQKRLLIVPVEVIGEAHVERSAPTVRSAGKAAIGVGDRVRNCRYSRNHCRAGLATPRLRWGSEPFLLWVRRSEPRIVAGVMPARRSGQVGVWAPRRYSSD